MIENNKKYIWSELEKTTLPILLYGTGNASDAIYEECKKRGIRISGCFASSSFVRDRYYLGFKVLSYERAKEIFGEMVVLMGFGTHNEDVIETIKKIAKENILYLPDLTRDKNGELFSPTFFNQNRESFEKVYSSLEDEESKDTFLRILNYRYTGCIDYLVTAYERESESWKRVVREGDSFLDLGSYNGDTILRFLSLVENRGRIIGVESDEKNYRKAKERLEKIENIELINAFISDEEGLERIISGKGRGSRRSEEGKSVKRISVDSLLNGEEISLIKLDVEGEEEKAIRGAKNTIEKYKPRLILSAYHRAEDFFSLFFLLKEYNPQYRFYLRSTLALPAWDVNFYVV